VAAPLKHAASLEEIAAKEGKTPRAIHTLICRALKKLRRQGLICTAKDRADDLDRNRDPENIVRNARRQ
jgi:hypothetical protein